MLTDSMVNTVLTGKMPAFIQPVLAFYNAILDPFDMTVYPMIGLVILAFVAIILLVKFIVLPNFYQAVSQTSSSKVKSRTCKTNGVRWQQAFNEIRDSLYASPINGRFGINANDY